MPFKSKKQKAKFAQMVKEGKISQQTFDEWNASTPENLPTRVKQKPRTAVHSVRQIKKIRERKFG